LRRQLVTRNLDEEFGCSAFDLARESRPGLWSVHAIEHIELIDTGWAKVVMPGPDDYAAAGASKYATAVMRDINAFLQQSA